MKFRYTKDDVERLHAVKTFLDRNYKECIRLKKLCYMAGMDRHRLQYGFQQLFGQTIFPYLLEKRMAAGRRMVTGSYDNLQVIASKVGYTHVSNFIAAYRRYYGCTPGQDRNDRQTPFG